MTGAMGEASFPDISKPAAFMEVLKSFTLSWSFSTISELSVRILNTSMLAPTTAGVRVLLNR